MFPIPDVPFSVGIAFCLERIRFSIVLFYSDPVSDPVSDPDSDFDGDSDEDIGLLLVLRRNFLILRWPRTLKPEEPEFSALRCVKRYVGHKSIVLATRPLPQEAIIAVDRELKERVQVEIVKSQGLHVIPDALVAALSHDLGKIESMRGFLYSLGEHPLASGRPLSGIPGFRDLPKKEEILQAVKLHHKRPQGLLGKTLKKADQLARQKELEEAALLHESELVPAIPPVPEKEKSARLSRGTIPPFHAEPFGAIAEMEKAKPEMLRDIVQVSPYLDNDTTDG